MNLSIGGEGTGDRRAWDEFGGKKEMKDAYDGGNLGQVAKFKSIRVLCL